MKILVGDDRIEELKQYFPPIPGVEMEFVDSADEVIEKGLTGEYDLIVTDLQYTPEGSEGFGVLHALRDVPSRKFLWTAAASLQGVKERGEKLGATVLDKTEIGTIVEYAMSNAPVKQSGRIVEQAISDAPVKQGGRILVYSGHDTIARALGQVMDTLAGEVTVSSDLERELRTGEYGLVIDTSTIGGSHGTVAHDLQYIHLKEVPRVIPMHDLRTLITDILRVVEEHYKK